MTMMKRITSLALLLLLGAVPSLAQGTVAPIAVPQYSDANGHPLANGRMYVYQAGTTTAATIYTDATLLVPALNAAVCSCANLDAAGRFSFFLSPSTYRFVLKTSADVLVWDKDGLSSVPPANVDVDVQGTAGETIAAGSVVYLSDGSGSKTAGRWYLADADFTYASSLATFAGMAPAAIASGSSGSFRIMGRISGLGGLSPGVAYYVSATAGQTTSTAPSNSRLLGLADSTSSMVIAPNPAKPSVDNSRVQGRLTLSSGVCVTTTDVTAATTIYFTPCGGNKIALYDGAAWQVIDFTQVSIAVPATTSTVYDVFGVLSSGALTLELLAWTNPTTRATLLTTQDGILVKTGAATRRYLGSFGTTAVSGQTENSLTKRLLWNYYNRVRLLLAKTDATTSWAYSTVAWRQAHADAANQVDVVVGVAEVAVNLALLGKSTSGSVNSCAVGIMQDAASGTQAVGGGMTQSAGGDFIPTVATLNVYPAVGRHFFAWTELGNAGVSFFGVGGILSGVTDGALSGWTEG